MLPRSKTSCDQITPRQGQRGRAERQAVGHLKIWRQAESAGQIVYVKGKYTRRTVACRDERVVGKRAHVRYVGLRDHAQQADKNDQLEPVPRPICRVGLWPVFCIFHDVPFEMVTGVPPTFVNLKVFGKRIHIRLSLT